MKTALTYIPQAGVNHRAISSRTAAIIVCAAALLIAALFIPSGVWMAAIACALPLVFGIG